MNQKLFDLDRFINISELENLHLEICSGIAKSRTDMSSRVIPHLEMQGDLSALIKFKLNEPPRIAAVSDSGRSHLICDKEKKIFDQLDREQKKRFLQLYKKAYWDGEYVRIKFPKNIFRDHPEATFYDSMCEWDQNANFFPNVIKFIEGLPFKEIGRILFFVSYHYLHSDVHYDRNDQCFTGSNHFIWFNPFQQKKFFLIDSDQQILDINCKSAFFDPRFLHGSKPSPRMTYSLRVDGFLEKDFCQQVGIEWRSRNS